MADKSKLSKAVSQRKNIPPLQRGKGMQISGEEAQQPESIDLQQSETQNEQKSEESASQIQGTVHIQDSDDQPSLFRKNAESLQSSKIVRQQSELVTTQSSDEAIVQDIEITEQQLKEFAKILQKVIAKEQNQDKAKQQKEDPADLLIQSLADVQFGFPELEQFRKLAEMQRKKVNQGVTIPESLFSIYKSCAMSFTLRGKKVTMGDLMAKALIKYLVEDLILELRQD
jgi:hypothetical protein